MRNFNLVLAVAAALLVGTYWAPARAASIGINFDGGSFGTPALLAPADVAGVVPQPNWNNEGGNAGGPVGGLVDSTGAAVAATVAWSSGNTWTNGDQGLGGPNNAMLSNYLDGGSGGPATVTIANIPYAKYDLYIYTERDGAGTSDYTVNGALQTVMVAGAGFYNANGFVLDTPTTTGNYLVFSGLTATTVNLSLSVNTVRSPIDGFQLVSVPEPASLVLCALGAIGLFVVARRRRKA